MSAHIPSPREARDLAERERRRITPRARTLSAVRVAPGEAARLRVWNDRNYPSDVVRPKTRGDCANGPRPCLFVSCKFNLYADVDPRNGSLKLNFPHLEPGEMTESCALDTADLGGATLEEVARRLNIVRERSRQLEEKALDKLSRGAAEQLREFLDGDSFGSVEPGARKGWFW